MTDWERKPNFFFAAALVVAFLGSLSLSRSPDAEQRSLGAVSAESAAAQAPPAPAAPAADGEDASEGLLASAASPLADDDRGMRDAVASLPSSGWAQQAARSAAFSGPGGRVPGAYAPAAAAPADAVRRALQPRATAAAGGSGGPSLDGPSPSNGSAAASAARPAEEDSESETAVRAKRARLPASPAARFFSGETGVVAEPSARGAAAAGTAAFPSGSAASPRQRAARPKKGRAPRPALLSKLLGKGALKAPLGLKTPRGNPWNERALPVAAEPLGVAAAEAIGAPPACRKTGAHWDQEGTVRWYHDGSLRGRLEDGKFAWARKDGENWWLYPAPRRAGLVRHQDHWWLKSRGLWFLLHDGEPWGWQYLKEWESDGLVNADGAQMIYNADGTRVGIVVPGEGAVLYDAGSGEELGRWTADQLPQKAGPHAPSQLPPVP